MPKTYEIEPVKEVHEYDRTITASENVVETKVDRFTINGLLDDISNIDKQIASLQERKIELEAKIATAKQELSIT